jgi:hypothetical protein
VAVAPRFDLRNAYSRRPLSDARHNADSKTPLIDHMRFGPEAFSIAFASQDSVPLKERYSRLYRCCGRMTAIAEHSAFGVVLTLCSSRTSPASSSTH